MARLYQIASVLYDVLKTVVPSPKVDYEVRFICVVNSFNGYFILYACFICFCYYRPVDMQKKLKRKGIDMSTTTFFLYML